MTCLLARYYFDNWTLYSPAVCYEHVRLSWNFNESSNTMTLLLGITLGAARGTPGMAAALALIEKRSGWKQKENTTHNKKQSTQKQGIIFFKSKACTNACSAAKTSLSWDLQMVKGQNHCTALTQQPALKKPAQREKTQGNIKDGGPGTSLQREWKLIPINLSNRCI